MVKVDHRIRTDEQMAAEVERYKNISRRELAIAGITYNESLSLYENLFRCHVSGCVFRNVYYAEYLQHMEQDLHCHDPRKGTDEKMSKVKIIDDIEESTEEISLS